MTLISRIDTFLKKMYSECNQPYVNDEGVGRFAEWVEDNGYRTEDVEADLKMTDATKTSLVDFDDNFPTNKTGPDRDKEIFIVLKFAACFFYKQPKPPRRVDDIEEEKESISH